MVLYPLLQHSSWAIVLLVNHQSKQKKNPEIRVVFRVKYIPFTHNHGRFHTVLCLLGKVVAAEAVVEGVFVRGHEKLSPCWTDRPAADQS